MDIQSNSREADQLGVVAIGRNEGERLVNCLASIKPHTNLLVYVDSGSTDGSISAAEMAGGIVVKLDLTNPFTAARARNEGFAALKALKPSVRFVQFVDGDCIVDQDWVDKATTFLDQQKDVAIVCGRRRERYPEKSIYNQLCDIEWDTPLGLASECGGDAMVRVEAFEATGGFATDLIAGEEPELCVRLRERGWKIWRLNAEMTVHDAAMTRFVQWWLRSKRCGYAYAEVSQRHWDSPKGIWRRETARALIWGGVLPIIILLASLLNPIAMIGFVIYIFQICRIAIRRGPTSYFSWAYAFFAVIGKLAEMQGILTLFWRRCLGKASELIEYK